ncbi:MAG: guaD [Phycisphaerales bacterium]|nr:guaD [Phycisphaerales bacterium]
MSPTDYLALAIAKAREGIRAGQMPYGAVVVLDGNVLACEHNIVRAAGDPSAHAEVTAIRKASLAIGTHDLTGCEVYTTCEPCLMCFGACFWAGAASIVYGAAITDKATFGINDPGVRSESLRELSKSPVKITGGVLREECLELFRLFTSRR